jgi:hypothetical protein
MSSFFGLFLLHIRKMFHNNYYNQTLSHLKILPKFLSDYTCSACDIFLFWTWFDCNTKVFVLCKTVLESHVVLQAVLIA